MKILDFLTGGGDQKTEQSVVPPKYLDKHLKPYIKDLRGAYDQTRATSPWSIPSYTGPNPTQRAAIEGQLSILPQQGAQIGQYQDNVFGMMNPLNNPFLQAGGQGALAGQDVFGQFASGQRDVGTTLAPTAQAQAAQAQAAQAQLSQLGSTPGLDRMLSANPNADVWSAMYGTMADNVMESFQEGVLPALRADAQGAGQFGQSRHGLAQSGAVGELTDTLGQMGTQFGQMGASEAINTRNLGAQLAQNPALANLAAANNMSQFNTGSLNQMGQFNAGALNQMGQFNVGESNRMGQINAGALNQMGQFNAGQQFAGAGGMQNMFNQAYSPSLAFSGQAMGQAPGAIQMGNMPFQTMMGLGGFENEANARAIGEQERIYGQTRADPMALLQQFGSSMGLPMSGTPAGSSSSTSGGGGFNLPDLAMTGLMGAGLTGPSGFGWWGGSGGGSTLANNLNFLPWQK